MEKIKLCKYIFVSMIFAIISMILTYGYHCLLLYLLNTHTVPANVRIWLVLYILSGLPLLVSQGIFRGLNKLFKWFNHIDIFKVITLEMVIYIILMITFFEHISVPNMLIPKGEMALGFSQIFIIVPAIITAIICGIISRCLYEKE